MGLIGQISKYAQLSVKIKKFPAKMFSDKCIQPIRLQQRYLRPEPIVTKFTLSRSVILAGLLSYAALPVVTYAATFGPGGGVPVPIGTSLASGPGGGVPVPIGTSLAFGPGGGVPVPIGRGLAFGPGGGVPVPIGTSFAFGPGGGVPVPIGTSLAFGPGGGVPVPIGTSTNGITAI